MAKNFECPICEHLLTVEGVHRAPKTCPECEQQVEWVSVAEPGPSSSNATLSVQNETVRPPILPGKMPGKQPTRSLSPPPPIKPRQKRQPVVVDADGNDNNGHSSSSDEILLENNASAGQSPSASQPVKTLPNAGGSIPTPIVITLGIATIGVLIAILYMMVFASPDPENTSESENTNTQTNKTNTQTPRTAPVKRPRDKLQSDELPTRLTLEDLEAVWPKVRSYVVALNIETAAGPRVASGVVVDSRGWIATSSRVLQGATKVVVTWPNTDFIDGSAKSTRRDEALGLVAQNREMDIAILAVGRNAIVELTEVETGDSSLIVESETLIAGAQPGAEKRLWLKDCRVATRPRFGDLHPVFQSILTKNSSPDDIDNGVKFMTHSGTNSPAIAGGPLFDKDGRLVAINTMLSFGNETLAVPASIIEALKKSTDGQISTFDPAVANDGNMAIAGIDSANQAAEETVTASTHPEVNEAKNAVGAARQLGLAPTDTAGYARLVSMSEALHKVNELRQTVEADTEEKKSLDHEIDDLTNGIVQELSTSGELSFETATQVNELFMAQRRSGNESYFAAYVKVKHPTMLSSTINDKATITFELVGSTQLMTSTVNEEADRLIVGTEGLVIGRLRPERYSLTVDGKPEEVIFCDALYFYEVKSWN